MVLANKDFPPDIRVEKEARALRDAGYKIVILCAAKDQRPLVDDWEGNKIIRMPPLSRIFRALNWLFRSITFHDLQLGKNLPAVIQENNIELLHVHDLLMLGTALSGAKKWGIPVIADLHENYPAALRYYLTGRSLANPFKWFLYQPSRWQAYEKRSAIQADHILVVVDEAKDRLKAEGLPSDKITVIENTVDVDNLLSIPLDNELIQRYEGEFVISYIGGYGGRHRGLDTVIEAMPQILEDIPKARLLMVGDGPIKSVLQQMVAERSIDSKVSFINWQPFEKIPSYITLSDICLVPHHSNAHTEATSPHKLFQYMLLRKPVVASSCKPLKRVIEETGGGLVFQAGDADSLAETIVQLQDPQLRHSLGEAGQRAVIEKYNWSETSKILVSVYEQFR
jgi:glycosyltransferase involved in cell wall biosynthesis